MTTAETAPTVFVSVDGTKLAYRLFGAKTGIPLVFLQHYRGTMDHWDPLPLNILSLTRPILLLDYPGTGHSAGTTPNSFSAIATSISSLISTLSIPIIDLLGFSIGGFAAQMLALNYPELVKHLVLCGTGPSAAEGLEATGDGIFEDFTKAVGVEQNREVYLRTFYTGSGQSQGRGREAWERILGARKERSDWAGEESTGRQIEAVVKWLGGEGDVSFPRLGKLNMPVMVAAGAEDNVVRTKNSLVLWRAVEKGYLCVYPNASHGFMSQHAEMFAKHVELFLRA